VGPALKAGSVDHEKSNRQDQFRYQSDQSVNHINYNKSSRRKSSAVGAYREQDRYVGTFGIVEGVGVEAKKSARPLPGG